MNEETGGVDVGRTGWRNIMDLITIHRILATVFLSFSAITAFCVTSCTTSSPHRFSNPTFNWQSKSGQIMYFTPNTTLIGAGERRVLLDLSTVNSVDSATIGCLMDLDRQATAAGGLLKVAGVQKRVETMLTMTGAQDVLDIHPDATSAIKSFGASPTSPD